MSKGTAILREQNKRKVLSLLRQSKKTTRKDLAEQMNVSKNTISLIVEEYIKDNVLKEVGYKEPGKKGRPKVLIQINEDFYKAIGFIISENNIEYAVTNYYGGVVESQTVPSNSKDPKQTKQQLRSLIETLLNKYEKVLGIGIGIPGIVDIDQGEVYESTRLGWRNVYFRDDLIKYDIPIVVQNSVNMGALNAIDQVENKQNNSLFYIRVGDGVGGAYIIDNNIINGGSWTVGEIGHISLQADGDLCDCGQRGCLELLINTNAFREKLNKLEKYAVLEEFNRSGSVIDSPDLKAILSEFGIYLGKALVQVIHLINPNQIVIDTPYNACEYFTAACMEYVGKTALQIPYQQTTISFRKEQSNLSVGAALSVIINFEKN